MAHKAVSTSKSDVKKTKQKGVRIDCGRRETDRKKECKKKSKWVSVKTAEVDKKPNTAPRHRLKENRKNKAEPNSGKRSRKEEDYFMNEEKLLFRSTTRQKQNRHKMPSQRKKVCARKT